MGTHPIFESDFDCLTEIDHSAELVSSRIMTECITYIIDYSENEDFRKKCFQLLRYDLETKILSGTKCEIQFILSSMEHGELSMTNKFNYPGMTESPTMFGNGPDNETYFEHLSKLEKLLESASFFESDLTQGLMLAMDSIIVKTKKFSERAIYVLSDMEKTKFSTELKGKILEKSRKIVQRRITKTPFYLFNSAEDTQLEMKLQTLGKPDRSKLVKTTYDKTRFETENGVTLISIPPFYTSILKSGDQSDSEDEDSDEDDTLSQMNAEIEAIQKQVRNKIPEEEVRLRKQLGGDIVDFGENCWRKVAAETKKGIHVIGKMSAVEAVQWYNFVGKETKIMRGTDSNNQSVLNTLGECLDKEEKPMGLIASYKYQEKSVPKICFLQPVRCEDTESYTFIFRYMPSGATNRKLRAPRLQKPKQDIQDLVDEYMDALDLDKLDFDDYKSELLSGHDLHLDLARKILFGHDVDTDIYNFRFDEFDSQEIDMILNKIGQFQQSNRPKSMRDASKRVNVQSQGSNNVKKQKTDVKSATQAMKDVTNVTDNTNDTAEVTNDDSIEVTKEEPSRNIPSKASPNHSIADSGMGASLAPSVVSTQKYSQLDDESDWSDGSF